MIASRVAIHCDADGDTSGELGGGATSIAGTSSNCVGEHFFCLCFLGGDETEKRRGLVGNNACAEVPSVWAELKLWAKRRTSWTLWESCMCGRSNMWGSTELSNAGIGASGCVSELVRGCAVQMVWRKGVRHSVLAQQRAARPRGSVPRRAPHMYGGGVRDPPHGDAQPRPYTTED